MDLLLRYSILYRRLAKAIVMSCDDFNTGRHTVGPAPHNVNALHGLALHAGCVPATTDCARCRLNGTSFTVCDNCDNHNAQLLFLAPGSPNININPRIQGNKDYSMNNLDRITDMQIGSSPQWHTLGPHGPLAAILPQVSPPVENPPWGGFLARVCDTCELGIRSHQLCLSNGTLNATRNAAMLPIGDFKKWNDLPLRSCTCRYELGFDMPPGQPFPRLCNQHRLAKLRELENRKDINDRWLRNIMQIPGTSGPMNIMRADFNMLAARRVQRRWRACRCGSELNQWPAPEALICMACEGWVSANGPLAWSRHAVNWMTPQQVTANMRATRFRLGRVAI
ncbi:hypothetical protein LTR17_019001 [Elasticomyces elasticus]|nr:hypothetical protein LTR17_019001 [Elasticomyces elasticus]